MATPGHQSQEPVNFIHQFLLAMDRIQETDDLNPTHVSLYVGLFTLWNLNHFRNPISINREQLMMISKIGSKHTYLKCLRGLEDAGFIQYKPSKNPLRGSMACIMNLENGKPNEVEELGLANRYKSEPSGGSSMEQALHPSLNTTNNTNNTNLKNNIDAEEFEKSYKKVNKNSFADKRIKTTIKDSSEAARPKNYHFTPPSKEEQITFLKQQAERYSIHSYPFEEEAEKFINYYAAKGWKVGAKSAMKDWQAAARNWLMNFNKFNSQSREKHQAGHLHNSQDKSYDVPL
jgi:hypothetical protein